MKNSDKYAKANVVRVAGSAKNTIRVLTPKGPVCYEISDNKIKAINYKRSAKCAVVHKRSNKNIIAIREA